VNIENLPFQSGLFFFQNRF